MKDGEHDREAHAREGGLHLLTLTAEAGVEPNWERHLAEGGLDVGGGPGEVPAIEVGGDEGDALSVAAPDLGRAQRLGHLGDRREGDGGRAGPGHVQVSEVLGAVPVLLLGPETDVDRPVLAGDVGDDVAEHLRAHHRGDSLDREPEGRQPLPVEADLETLSSGLLAGAKGTILAFVGYSHPFGDVATDPSLPIVGVDSRLNTTRVGYLTGRPWWLEAARGADRAIHDASSRTGSSSGRHLARGGERAAVDLRRPAHR